MMQEWFTNAELAALNLAGFPNSRKGVEKWFKARGYDVLFPAKVRVRKGSGGGTERHITLLPKALQGHLALRHLKTAEAPPMQMSPVVEIPEPSASQSVELRMDAILLVLNFWDIFRAKFPGGIESARYHFCTIYSNGMLEGVPAWVRTALTTNAGKERGVCPTTLKRWEMLRAVGQFAALGGSYGNRKDTGVLDTAEDGKVAEFLAALIVKHPQFSAEMFQEQLIARFGETLNAVSGKTGEIKTAPMPSVRTIRRWVAEWRSEHDEVLTKLTDPDGYKNSKRVTGRNMNHWVRRPNQLWETDASPVDALAVDGRYALYAVVDIYTRRMKVLVTKTPKTSATLALLRRCILDWGVPEILRTDNGSDFTSHAFRRAITALGIHHDICDPFSPEQKGTVERHIGTLQRGPIAMLEGYIGHSVADRKKIEARKAFAQRLGESDEKAFCVSLTHEQIQEALDAWIELKYHNRIHGGLDGKTPFQMISEWTGPIRRIENERALDLMLAPIAGKDGLRRVTREGIGIGKDRFLSPGLAASIGEDVLCRHDPEDMGRLYVYSADGRDFICVATCARLLGENPGDAVRALREAQDEWMATEVEPLKRQIRAMKPGDAIAASLRVAAANAGNVAPFPKRTEAYSTPALDAAADASRAEPTSVPASSYSPEMQASIARIRAEMAAAVATEKPQNPKDRYRRALAIRNAIDAGETVPADDLHWWNGYRDSAEFTNHEEMHREFGALYLVRASTA